MQPFMTMLQSLKNTANMTRTENGAATLRSTGAEVLDLFAAIGAMRDQADSEIITRFQRAWAEDKELALKTLFYARDIRNGLGERRVFRVILKWLACEAPASVCRNIPLIAEYGRWDDLLVLLGTPCERAALDCMKNQLKADLAAKETGEPVSLLAKWLPSVNASNAETVRQAKWIAWAFDMSDAEYRRTLSGLRAEIKILENYLRCRNYTFVYAKQPSKALFKYRRAFIRNDQVRYSRFLKRVAQGKEVLHTGSVMPYDLVRQALNANSMNLMERQTLDVTWKALENFTDGRNALAVVDGSGSMYWSGQQLIPAHVALSLGLYFAQHNTGAFHNHFITFSEHPRLVEIKGDDFAEQIRYCKTFNEVANTNLQAVFQLILDAAVSQKLPQKELPETLYIISDMEFDSCTRNAGVTNFQMAKQMYEAHGYKLPKVVFWNVNSRTRQQPVSMKEQGVALVSGATPRIFSMVMEGETNPYTYMRKILDSERYAAIKI